MRKNARNACQGQSQKPLELFWASTYEGTEASSANRIPQFPRKKNARGEKRIKKGKQMALRSRSNRAVIGFLVGGIAGYWFSHGNLLWTIAGGVIGALLAVRFLD